MVDQAPCKHAMYKMVTIEIVIVLMGSVSLCILVYTINDCSHRYQCMVM